MNLPRKMFTAWRVLLAAFLVIGTLVSLGLARAADTAAAVGPAEAAVREASALEVRAFMDQAPARLADLWSDTMVVSNPLNRFVTRQQVLGMVRSGVLTFTAYERVIDYAHAYGNTVILAGHENVTWGSRMPHAGKAERLLFTAVWVRQGGRWQEVVRHAHVVPAASL